MWSRLALWALAAATVLVFEDELNPNRDRWDSPRLHELGAVVDVWARWDSEWYLRIAESGYDWPSSTPAFFPLYPLLVGGLGRILGGQFLLAGLVVSLAACAVAFVLLYRLVRRRLRPDDALPLGRLPRALPDVALPRRGVRGVALPRARARRPSSSSRSGAWAGRPSPPGSRCSHDAQGVALLPALAVFAWRSDRRRRDLAAARRPRRDVPRVPARARGSRSGTASRSSTRSVSGSAHSRRSGRSAGSSRRSARETCSGRSSPSRCSALAVARLAEARSAVRGLRDRRARAADGAALGAARRPLLVPASRARRIPVSDRPRDPRARPARPRRGGRGSRRRALAVNVVRWALWYWVA